VALSSTPPVHRGRQEGCATIGSFLARRVADEDAPAGAEALLQPAMVNGARMRDEPLDAMRARAAEQRNALAPEHRLLDAKPYAVEPGMQLEELRATLADSLSP
jgi:hypothetical protein